MKFLILAAISLCVSLLSAQEPPLPSPTETPTTSPSARPQLDIPDIPMSVEPSPLVPNTSATPKKTAPAISELDALFQHSSLGASAEEYKLHVEWRQLKNRTAHDPEVLAAKAAADVARTDVAKRKAMRLYYKVFYAHMEALASTPEIKAYLEQKKNELINGLAQPNVRPEPTVKPKSSPTKN